MSILRSEEMGLYTLRIAKDYAHEVIEIIGWQSALHFINPDKRVKQSGPFIDVVRKCIELQKIIEYLEDLCKLFEIPLANSTKTHSFTNAMRSEELFQGKNSAAYFEEAEQYLHGVYGFVLSQQGKSKEAKENYSLLEEKEAMIRILAKNKGEDVKTNIARIAISVNKAEEMRFKRLLFRKTKGNSLILAEDTFDSKTKTMYVILLRGEQLKNSILAACESYSQNV